MGLPVDEGWQWGQYMGHPVLGVAAAGGCLPLLNVRSVGKLRQMGCS